MNLLSMNEISKKFHVNASYLSYLFKAQTGKTFTEYITNKRIEYSCKLLRETELSIGDIAEQAGFRDYFYFSRVFRKVMNRTPSEYRNLTV